MNSKRMLLRLLRLGLLSLFFVHQTTPALSIIEESVKELIVERRVGYYDSFTIKMKTDRTCNVVTCPSLGAFLVHLSSSSCECQCGNYEPYTFLSSIQRCANTTQVHDFGGELIAYITLAYIRLHYLCAVVSLSQIKHGRGILENAECKTRQYKTWTADCGLRSTDCGLGIKHGLGIKCGLRILRKPATNWSIIYIFLQNGHVTNHLSYWHNIYTLKCWVQWALHVCQILIQCDHLCQSYSQ